MQFTEGFIYHIYNQGNNRQKVFFNRENYLFFLRKMSTHLKPYGDIIAWCLMPNHFHIMMMVNRVSHLASASVSHPASVSLSNQASASLRATPTLSQASPLQKTRTLNDSIGIMLRSYTIAINKQETRTGKLFREKTKAECINCPYGITPSFFNTQSGTQVNIVDSEKQYPQVCFNYIHQNPVKAGLVANPVDWEYSSFQDYFGGRMGKLVNKGVAAEYVSW
jgi:putative transposase